MNPFRSLDHDAKKIFSLIQKKGPLTKNNLLAFLNTNIGVLNRTMAALLDLSLIVEVGNGASTGGRKPVLYDVNRNGYYAVGIDISRPYAQIVITNLKMEVLDKRQFEMDETCTPEKTVRQIGAIVRILLELLRLDHSRILGIGLGTVGPLDPEAGIMTTPQNFLASGWTDVPIKKLLEEELELATVIDTGANSAVLAENLFGEGRQYQNIAYFHCSGGIRTGATAGNAIVRTINNAEDTFGHMIVDADGEPCHCGNFGCVQSYASIFAIRKKFVAELKLGRSTSIAKPWDQIRYTDICNAATGGDDLAREIITRGACYFGIGLANYIQLLNPGLVILSGPLIAKSDLFYTTAVAIAVKKLNLLEKNRVVFSKGGYFGDETIAVGGAVMLVETYLKQD